MKISKQILLLNIIGVVAIISMLIIGYGSLNGINKNVTKIHNDTQLLKEQTLALNSLVQQIKLNISLTKMEAFESIVSQKPVAQNSNYLKALNNTKTLLLNLKH